MKKISLVVLFTFILSLVGIAPMTANAAVVAVAADGITMIEAENYTATSYSGVPGFFASEGKTIGPFNSGDWYEYEINVAETGKYAISAVIWSPAYNTYSVNVGDVEVIGQTMVAPTCDSWATVAVDSRKIGECTLEAGNTTIKFFGYGLGGYIDGFTLEWLGDGSIPVEPTDVTIIQAENYADYEGGTITVEGADPAVFGFNKDLCVSYYINVKEAGKYMLSMQGGYPVDNTFSVILESTGKEIILPTIITSSGGWTNWKLAELGEMNLPAGKHTIKILSYGMGCYFDYFTLEKTGEYDDGSIPVEATGVTTIQAEKYSDYEGGTITVEGTDPKVFGFNKDLCVSYFINVKEAGKYTLSMQGGYPVDNTFSVILESTGQEIILPSTIPSSGGWTNWSLAELGEMNLPAGKHTIKILSYGMGCYFDYFTLEKTGEYDDGSIPVEATGVTTIQAEDYSDYEGGTITVEGTDPAVFGFNKDLCVSYFINVKEAGKYTLSMQGGYPVDNTFSVILESTGKEIILPSTIPSSGGWTNWTLAELGEMNLPAGKHTIKILSYGMGCYFDYFTLEKTGEYDDGSIPVGATGVTTIQAESYKDAENGNILIEGTDSKFFALNKDYCVTYFVDVEETGTYKLSMYGAFPVLNTFSVILDSTGEELIYRKDIPSSGGWTNWTRAELGNITLPAGKHTIKILSYGMGCYFDYLTIEKADTVQPMAVLYADESNMPETVMNGRKAIPFMSGVWAEYTVDAEKAGYYNLRADITGSATANEITVYVDGNKADVKEASPDSVYSYSTENIGDVYLKEGENIIKVLYSGSVGSSYLGTLTVYAPTVTLYKTEIAEANAITKLENGKIIAEAKLNGLFSGENTAFAIAIYKGNKLDRIAYSEKAATDDTVLTDMIENVALEDGYTYTAKVMIWDNMAGECRIY